MPPHTNNNCGGGSGRAASATADRCAAARAGNFPAFAVVAGAVAVLVLNAPGLWPQLFLP